MARITFSITDDLSEAAAKKAESERRTLSSYISGLVEKDAIEAGLLKNGSSAEVTAWVDELGTKRALTALRREARKLKAS